MVQQYKLVSKVLFLIFAIVLFLPKKTLAATLSLSPQSQTVKLSTPFTINLDLDTKGEKTTATDVLLTFDPALLEITAFEFSQPPLYPVNTKIIDNTTGKLRVTSAQQDAVNSYQGAANLAVITFNPKALGTASVVFTCEAGKYNESNVFKKGTSTDVIECGNLGNGTYVIGQGGVTSLTPPTTPKPTLPATGNIGPTGIFVIGGAALLGIGTALVLLL